MKPNDPTARIIEHALIHGSVPMNFKNLADQAICRCLAKLGVFEADDENGAWILTEPERAKNWLD